MRNEDHPEKLPRAEWDFSIGNLKEEDLEIAFYWEFLREAWPAFFEEIGKRLLNRGVDEASQEDLDDEEVDRRRDAMEEEWQKAFDPLPDFLQELVGHMKSYVETSRIKSPPPFLSLPEGYREFLRSLDFQPPGLRLSRGWEVVRLVTAELSGTQKEMLAKYWSGELHLLEQVMENVFGFNVQPQVFESNLEQERTLTFAVTIDTEVAATRGRTQLIEEFKRILVGLPLTTGKQKTGAKQSAYRRTLNNLGIARVRQHYNWGKTLEAVRESNLGECFRDSDGEDYLHDRDQVGQRVWEAQQALRKRFRSLFPNLGPDAEPVSVQ